MKDEERVILTAAASPLTSWDLRPSLQLRWSIQVGCESCGHNLAGDVHGICPGGGRVVRKR
jgi:hypothetical protein